MNAILVLFGKRLWSFLGGLILSSVFVMPGTARAGAIYFAEAIGTLEITGIAHAGGGVDVFIDGEGIPDPIFDEAGTGVADGVAIADVLAPNFLDLGVGDSIAQIAESSGMTTPPSGFAVSDIFTDGTVSITNDSAFEVTVSFSFEYSLAADTSVMDPLREFALAEAIAEVFTDSVDVLFDVVESDSDHGGGLFASSDSILFNVVVPGFAMDTVEVFIDTFGVAATDVPEPATLILFGLGLAGLGFSRRREV